MIIPSYWASHADTYRRDGRQYTVRRWGWSDLSQEAAQTHARLRVERAIGQVDYQWPNPSVPRNEPKSAYNGAEGVPIREEVIERRGDEILTRNSYGSLCLNTPDIMFIDIDEEKIWQIPEGRMETAFLALLALGMSLTLMYYEKAMGLSWWAAWAVVLAQGPWAINRAWRTLEMVCIGGTVGLVNRQLHHLVKQDPSSAWALYQTPGGYRVMGLHRRFDPCDAGTYRIMEGFDADRLYALMCKRQGCFRARVSPKPWRMAGFSRLTGPIWPVEGQALLKRNAWVDEYNQVAPGYASCRFLETVGNLSCVDAQIDHVKAWHDEMSQANSDKPLA